MNKYLSSSMTNVFNISVKDEECALSRFDLKLSQNENIIQIHEITVVSHW